MGLAVFGLPADVVLYALDNDVTPAKVLLIFQAGFTTVIGDIFLLGEGKKDLA